jgi:mRNA-capping enzyme
MTLIDGEMIIDTVPDSGLKRRYLAYDLMALGAVPKTKVICCGIIYTPFVPNY